MGDVITYAYLPQYSHAMSYRRHYPLLEYLRKETGLKIKQIFPDTFDEHMRMVGQGKIDISFSNPLVCVKLAQEYGSQAFAQVLEVYGRRNFRGQTICRADNQALRTLEDCRGKRWIAVDPSSSGGYLYPLKHFYDHGKFNLGKKRVAPDLMPSLQNHPWEGNVRELANTIERGVIMAPREMIQADDIGWNRSPSKSRLDNDQLLQLTYREAKQQVLEQFNVKYISHMLQQNGGNITQAARQCGVERQSLQQIIKKCGIDTNKFR